MKICDGNKKEGEIVFVNEVATEMRSAMGKAWKWDNILSRSTP